MSDLSYVRIDPNGDVLAVYSDDFAEVARDLGECAVTRASHVEPSGDGWAADLSPVGGPTLGPFSTRKAALAAEVEWLYANVV